MASYSDPAHRYQSGDAITRRRMNDMADRMTRNARDTRAMDLTKDSAPQSFFPFYGKVKSVDKTDKTAIVYRVSGKIADIQGDDDSKYTTFKQTEIWVYTGTASVKVDDIIRCQFAGLDTLPQWIIVGGMTSTRYKVTQIHDDFVTCRTYDGTTTGTEDVKIAKPYLLRRTTMRDGTWEWQADRQSRKSGTSTEFTTQSYKAGDEIYAITCDVGTVKDYSVSPAKTLDDVTELDMNIDGRLWCSDDK